LAGSEPPVPLLPEEGCRRFGDGVVGAAGGMAPDSTHRVATLPAQAETRPLGSVSCGTESGTRDQRRETRDSFPDWLKRVAPNMRWDWKYQKMIYEKLEEITHGRSRRLMIFLPPRHGK